MNTKILKKFAIPTSKLIKNTAVFAANSASPWWTYQPVEPKEMDKFKKIKR
jgi:cyclic lactone autoinducer peptide